MHNHTRIGRSRMDHNRGRQAVNSAKAALITAPIPADMVGNLIAKVAA